MPIRITGNQGPITVHQWCESVGAPDTSHCLDQTPKTSSVLNQYATVQQLIEALITKQGQVDRQHFDVFFATYRTFTNSSDVLQTILRLFETWNQQAVSGGGAANRCKQVGEIIALWLIRYPEDFEGTSHAKFRLLESILDISESNRQCFKKAQELASKSYCKNKGDLNHYQDVLHHRKTGAKISTHSYQNGFNCYYYYDRIEPYNLFLSSDINGYHGANIAYFVQVFLSMDTSYIAAQITAMDIDLLMALRPYQCLAKFWNRRHDSRKNSENPVQTVLDTVNQFNDISSKVVSAILLPIPSLTPKMRTKLMSKWIDVLTNLRLLRNYSSVRAVVSALQAEPIFRLSPIWASLPRAQSNLFQDIQEGYGREENCLEVLADDPHVSVPYLGAFLTQLVHLDAAHPEKNSDGQINFHKKILEHKVLSQIQQFQASICNYAIRKDESFMSWFSLLPTYPEDLWMDLSLRLEPKQSFAGTKKRSKSFGSLLSLSSLITDLKPGSSTWSPDQKGRSCVTSLGSPDIVKPRLLPARICPALPTSKNRKRARRISWATTPELSCSKSNSTSVCGFRQSEFDATTFARWMMEEGSTRQGCTPEENSFDCSTSLHSLSINPFKTSMSVLKKSVSAGCLVTNGLAKAGNSKPKQKDYVLLRVRLDSTVRAQSPLLSCYKTIRIEITDKTEQVIVKALKTHKIAEPPSNFSLFQTVSSEKSVPITKGANVYYALNKDDMGAGLNAVLSTKSADEPNSQDQQQHRKPFLSVKSLWFNSL